MAKIWARGVRIEIEGLHDARSTHLYTHTPRCPFLHGSVLKKQQETRLLLIYFIAGFDFSTESVCTIFFSLSCNLVLWFELLLTTQKRANNVQSKIIY